MPIKRGHVMSKKPKLIYKSYEIDPEELLIFVELEPFSRRWADYDLTDEDLVALQILIMSNPRLAPVMKGTKGLRKLRYSPEGWKTGKSGALRVCYVYFQEYGWALLCLVFKKGELDNISSAGRKAVNRAIETMHGCLKEKYGF